MWTHLHPFLEASFTEEAIQHRARISLYRALNLGRLIAFTGSGTTVSFGMPSWQELGREFVKATDQQLREAAEAGGQDLWTLERKRPQLEQLRRMLGLARNAQAWWSLLPEGEEQITIGESSIIIELCEAILTDLPADHKTGRERLWLARRDFCKGFRAGTDALATRRLRNLFPEIGEKTLCLCDDGTDIFGMILSQIATGTSPSDAVDRYAKALTGDEGQNVVTALQKLQKLYAGTEQGDSATRLLKEIQPEILHRDDKALSAGVLPPKDINVIDALVNKAGIKRFLTMNYDVQLERAFLETARRRGAEPGITPFEHLCREQPTDRDDPRTVTIEDGLRRAARSATLAAGEVGSMISFAAFARTYDQQVFHLHGRLDDPSNIVLTQKDYRRVYLGDDDAEQAFFEAQEVTFGGNDFLIVGVGMKEADVLRPFRRFVSRGVAPDQSPRGIFCLIAREHDEGKQQKALENAINWIVHYDAYTIFYGDKEFTKKMAALDAIGEFLESKKDAQEKQDEKKAALENALSYLQENHSEDWAKIAPWSATELQQLEKSDTRKVAVAALLDHLRGQANSRALVKELGGMRKQADRWWKAFRTSPRERRALYSRVKDDTALGTITARHRVTGHRTQGGGTRWTLIEQLASDDVQKTIERKASTSKKDALNILRLALPRGGGKGSLIHLLMHRENRRHVFGRSAADPDYEYSDAFIAHLSFSMEFNSVLRAFSRFIATRIAEIQVAPLRGHHPFTPDSHEWIVDVVAKLLPDGVTTPERCEAACNAFVEKRREEPELALETDAQTTDSVQLHVKRGTGAARVRRHRLHTLRALLEKYEAIAPPNERVFVCLSNLDRICDSDGDGHNPVHRAFFRLITASADTKDYQTKPPIDLLLLSGRPEIPIRYLSKEGPPLDKIQLADQTFYSTSSKSKAVLERWHQPQPATWRDRVYLTALTNIPRDAPSEQNLTEAQHDKTLANLPPDKPELLASVLDEGLSAFETHLDNQFKGTLAEDHHSNHAFRRTALLVATLEKATARLAKGGVGVRGVYRQITQLLLKNAALTGLVITLWARMPINQEREGGPNEKADLVDFLRRLDAAAGRYPEAVYDVILSQYRTLDEKALEDESQPRDKRIDPAFLALIIRHLALFSLPVEPWVLLGCPILLAELRALIAREAPPGEEAPASAAKNDAIREWERRSHRLHVLRRHLEELVQRGLVIEVAPAVMVETNPDDREIFIHRRFSIHARLREHLTRQMRLSVINEGDSNHHQLSIYCDQPRDLPTPSRDHFAMISDILGLQIARCRRTLELFYILRPLWHSQSKDEDRAAAIDRATRILFSPKGRKDDIAGYLGELHAVPQRLRGCYSLLRGAFSLGAISRLHSDALSDNGEAPFEIYQGWLRALCNAAVGLEWNNLVIDAVLKTDPNDKDRAFRDDVSDEPDNKAGENKELVGIAQERYERLFDNHGTKAPDFAQDIPQIRSEIYAHARRSGLEHRQRSAPPFSKIRHPFYRDEIAWAYNERGLAALVQGKVFDAVPLFGIARRVVEHSRAPHDEPHYHHAAEHRIVLNLAIAHIERGRIAEARDELERIERQTKAYGKWTPNPLNIFTRGYLALCDHLSGNMQRARTEYEKTIDDLVEAKRLRPVSIFNGYLADLLRAQGDLKGARNHADLAISAAAQAEQRDVQHYASNALARVLALTDQREEAMDRARRIINYAGKMGLYGLKVEGELTRGNLLFQSGDTQLAGAAIAKAIALSTRCGMRLRRLRALSLYSEIQIKLDRIDIARTVLEEAKSEAERVGYQTQAARISETIASIG